MTLNDAIALVLRYFTEFGTSEAHCVNVVEDVVKTSRSCSLPYLLVSFLSPYLSFCCHSATSRALHIDTAKITLYPEC